LVFLLTSAALMFWPTPALINLWILILPVRRVLLWIYRRAPAVGAPAIGA
jgi:hypothetical protein